MVDQKRRGWVRKQKLIRLREGKGLSQKALAEALGVTQATVSRWEAGLIRPRVAVRLKLKDLLGLEPSQRKRHKGAQ